MLIQSDSPSRSCAALIICAAILLPAKASAFWPFDSNAEVMAQACEALIAERIKSPSSYLRLSASDILRDPGTLDDYLGETTSSKRAANAIRAGKDADFKSARDAAAYVFRDGGFDRISIIITYESANSFGASLRADSVCSEYVLKGAPFEDGPLSDLRLDGMTSMEWLTDQANQLMDEIERLEGQ